MKAIARLMAVLLAVAAIAAAVLRQNAIGAARAEQETLRGQSEETRRLEAQNAEIGRLRMENGELEKLRAENKDLPKLRNEVRQLRRQAEELERLRAENAALKNAPAGGGSGPYVNLSQDSFARADLKDVGFDIPRMTLETYFWAMSTGNLQRLRECLTPEAAAELQTVLTEDAFRNGVQKAMENFTGYEITGRTQNGPGEVTLEVKSLPGTGTSQMRFVQTAGQGWKFAGH